MNDTEQFIGTGLCSVCRRHAAVTWAHWNRRRERLAANAGVEVAPCFACGSRDWATSYECITEPFPVDNKYRLTLALAIGAAAAVAFFFCVIIWAMI